MIDRGTVDQEAVASQVQLVLSRDLAREVIEELELRRAAGVQCGADGVLADDDSADRSACPRIRCRCRSKSGCWRLLRAAHRLRGRQVPRHRRSNSSRADPELAARVANTDRREIPRAAAGARSRIRRAPPANGCPARSRSCATRCRRPRARSRSSAPSPTCSSAPTTPACPTSSSANSTRQVSAARAQKADAEARARLIRDSCGPGNRSNAPRSTNSELIRRLSEQRVTLRAQLAEQSSTLLPQHPRIKELRAQIADLDQQIRYRRRAAGRARWRTTPRSPARGSTR